MRLRRERPPQEVRARFDADERVLTWGITVDGTPVVATQRGLWLGEERLDWHDIDSAAWDDGVLTVTPARVVDGVIEELPQRQWELDVIRKLPQVVRARVTRSVAFTEHYPVQPFGGARIVGRRVSGRDGVSWAVRYDAGTDPQNPVVRGQIEEYLAQAQERFTTPEV